jgi:hypothetical protein
MAIDAIIANNDLMALAEKDGATFKKTLTDWRSACPIHHGEDKSAFALFYDGDKWRWKCYSGTCGGGDVIDYIMARDRVDIKRALEIMDGGKPYTPEEARAAAEQRRIQAEAYEAKKRAEYEQALSELHQARAWETYCVNLERSVQAQGIWASRGIPDDWQHFWSLGYCPDFSYKHDGQLYHSPTLTIPIYAGQDMPVNIRHRLLEPVEKNDKYRPDRPGLKAYPFMADYHDPNHDHILVVEGEIKAMVTYITLDSAVWQIFGIPGKSNFHALEPQLKDKLVWILFDPDAREQAEAAARAINGRVVQLAMKVDDAITGGYLDKCHLRHLLKMAPRVR